MDTLKRHTASAVGIQYRVNVCPTPLSLDTKPHAAVRVCMLSKYLFVRWRQSQQLPRAFAVRQDYADLRLFPVLTPEVNESVPDAYANPIARLLLYVLQSFFGCPYTRDLQVLVKLASVHAYRDQCCASVLSECGAKRE